MLWWMKGYPVIQMSKEAEITEDQHVTFISGSVKFVLLTKLFNTQIILGGPSVIVQIDESQFKHKPKVSRILTYFTNMLFFL